MGRLRNYMCVDLTPGPFPRVLSGMRCCLFELPLGRSLRLRFLGLFGFIAHGITNYARRMCHVSHGWWAALGAVRLKCPGGWLIDGPLECGAALGLAAALGPMGTCISVHGNAIHGDLPAHSHRYTPPKGLKKG